MTTYIKYIQKCIALPEIVLGSIIAITSLITTNDWLHRKSITKYKQNTADLKLKKEAGVNLVRWVIIFRRYHVSSSKKYIEVKMKSSYCITLIKRNIEESASKQFCHRTGHSEGCDVKWLAQNYSRINNISQS